MPSSAIKNPAGAFGQPLFASVGLNEQLLVEVNNNTGMPIFQGMVMCWDVLQAYNSTPALLMNAAASGTVATQTITVKSSTAGYTPGNIMTATNVKYAATGCGPLNNYVGNMTCVFGGLSGSTFTNAYLPFATATNGLTATTAFYMSPTQGIVPNQIVGMNSTITGTGASDVGRAVTFSSQISTTLTAKDPYVAGVVSPTGDAGTNGQIIYPGQNFLMCVGGTARVFIGGVTVAANALLCTAAGVVGAADDATPTLGNLLGLSLEAQTAIDTNQTIRAIIKVG